MLVSNHVDQRMYERFGKDFETFYQENKKKQGFAKVLKQEQINIEYPQMRFKQQNHDQKYIVVEDINAVFTVKGVTVTTVLFLEDN